MRKYRFVAFVFLVSWAVPLTAQEVPVVEKQEEPQIGYRILSTYFDKMDIEGNKGMKIAGSILTISGGLMLGGAATTWFAGDQISQDLYGVPMDTDTKKYVSIGLGVGGVVTSSIGMGLLFSKPIDYHVQYAEVFNESDASVREALAVAALMDLSMKGKSERIMNGILNLATPLFTIAINALSNLSEGNDWYDNIMEGGFINAGNIALGLSSLFGTSEEERLYEKYRAGRDALYGDRDSGTGN